MSKKSRLFLALACVAFVVSMLRFVHSVTVSENVCDFATGFGVAMLLGTMVAWSDKRN
jgi:hypothetical protein